MNIAELFVRLSVDPSGMKKGVSSAQTSMDALKSAALKLSGVLGAAALFRGIINNSVEAQSALAQLEARVQSTGGAAGRTVPQLQAQASALQSVTTFSDEAVQGAQALLLTFKKIKGDEFDRATAAALDLATAMGGDIKGAALQLGKALEDPVRGLTALRRSGVSFTAAQQDVIKHLVETGRVAEAQNLILKEMESQFGGAAKAARNTLGGALQGLANAWGDALEVSGAASAGIAGAINGIGEVIPAVRDRINKFFTLLQELSINAAVNVERLRVGYRRFGAAITEALANAGDPKAAAELEGVNKALKDGEAHLRFMEAAAVETMADLYKLPPPVAKLNTELSGLEEPTTAAAAALKKLVDEAANITEGARIPTQIWSDTIATLDVHLKAGRITQQTWYQAVAEATVALGNAAKVTAEKLNPALAEALRITESVRTPTEVYRDRLIELSTYLQAGQLSQETFNRAMVEAAEVLKDSTEATNRFGEAAAGVAARGIDDFAAFAVGAGGSISDFVKHAMQDLAKLIARLAIVGALKAAVMGGAFGGGSFAHALLGVLEKRAGGGPVRSGRAYMVGERGPEVFVPSSSGTIVPSGGGAAALLAGLPPIPRPMSPNEAAIHVWYREAFKLLAKDNAERG